MTLIRLGYVAMSVELTNSSPSQTMTYTQYEKIGNIGGARRKLERIAQSNLENCLRLLKHNLAHDITFFRLSSKLVPLATHEDLAGWDYLTPLKDILKELGEFINQNNMRVDFHPDHFVLLNSPKKEIFTNSIQQLRLHKQLLKGMLIDLSHRCVLHVGGSYKDKELAMERFIDNWGMVQNDIQRMLMLENDDKSFNLDNTLFLCEKLGIPLVFDYHHHLANNEEKEWEMNWERVINTWTTSPLPIKMHISSPKNDNQYRHHADYIDSDMFLRFLHEVNGSVEQIDCMIEAKRKDHSLFQLMKDLKEHPEVEMVDGASFRLKT